MPNISCIIPKIITLIPYMLVMLFCSQEACAENFVFSPRASLGLMDFEYREPAPDSGFVSIPDFVLSDTLPFVSLGLTVAISQLYVDVYQQFTSEGKTDSDFYGQTKFDREEQLVTLGYTMSKDWSLFAGYRNTRTDVKNDFDGFSQLTFKLDYKGPYIGANRLWSFTGFGGGKKVFSAKVSLNYLKLDLESKLEGVSGSRTNQTGDALGLNFGVSLAGILENDVQYSFAIDTYDFGFDVSGTDSTEKVVRFSMNFSKPLIL